MYDFKVKVGDSYFSINFTENCIWQLEVKTDSIESIKNEKKY